MKLRTDPSPLRNCDLSDMPFKVDMVGLVSPNAYDLAEKVFAAISWINDVKYAWGGEFKHAENRYIFYFKNQQDAALFAIFWGSA